MHALAIVQVGFAGAEMFCAPSCFRHKQTNSVHANGILIQTAEQRIRMADIPNLIKHNQSPLAIGTHYTG